MKIAIASGKGGTGKTTLSVALALSATGQVTYVDCDVEEPNGHIFMKPEFSGTEEVTTLVPEVDKDKCNGCGTCAEVCQFNAIAALGKSPLIFPELCHSCGLCALKCPEKALFEVPRRIGELSMAKIDGVNFVQGKLDVGVAMSPPLIDKAKECAGNKGLIIYDSPPGTACPVVAALVGCDYAVLVTEPTPFGLHDLSLAVDLMDTLKIPYGVVINRYGAGDNKVDEYCAEKNIEILTRIPHDRAVAEAYSEGKPLNMVSPDYARQCTDVLERIIEVVEG